MAHKLVGFKLIGDEEKTQKKSKYQYDRLFKRGCNLSWCLYLLSILFFTAWVIGNSRESLLIRDSSSFSRIFFFLNPNLFNEIIFKGNALAWMSGAVNLNSFIFLACYIVALTSFVATICCAIWLFLISYNTSVKFFHYVSCFAVFPIFSWVFLTWWMLTFTIYKISKKRGKPSKFDSNFEPEKFDEPRDLFDEKYLASRPITAPFDYSHYQNHYKKFKKQDSVQDWHKALNEYLD